MKTLISQTTINVVYEFSHNGNSKIFILKKTEEGFDYSTIVDNEYKNWMRWMNVSEEEIIEDKYDLTQMLPQPNPPKNLKPIDTDQETFDQLD